MCESNVFVRHDSGDELVAENVARVIPEGETVRVMTLLGDETKVEGDIAEIDLMAHRIVVKPKSQ
jgi:predicted RNA-binding protein